MPKSLLDVTKPDLSGISDLDLAAAAQARGFTVEKNEPSEQTHAALMKILPSPVAARVEAGGASGGPRGAGVGDFTRGCTADPNECMNCSLVGRCVMKAETRRFLATEITENTETEGK